MLRIPAEPGLAQRVPDRVDHRPWSVERGERAAARVGVFLVAEQFAQPAVDLKPRLAGGVLLKRLLGSAPARVRGEGADVVVGGFSAAFVEVAQHLDGVDVRPRAFEIGSRGLPVRVE